MDGRVRALRAQDYGGAHCGPILEVQDSGVCDGWVGYTAFGRFQAALICEGWDTQRFHRVGFQGKVGAWSPGLSCSVWRQSLADQAQPLKPVFLAIVPVGVFSRRPPRDSPAKLAALLPVWLCSCSISCFLLTLGLGLAAEPRHGPRPIPPSSLPDQSFHYGAFPSELRLEAGTAEASVCGAEGPSLGLSSSQPHAQVRSAALALRGSVHAGVAGPGLAGKSPVLPPQG